MSSIEIDVASVAPAQYDGCQSGFLQEALKTAWIHDGVVHGSHEAAKLLDRMQAVLDVLAENCVEPM
nr:unnamed protein product [Callosobruchus analis]